MENLKNGLKVKDVETKQVFKTLELYEADNPNYDDVFDIYTIMEFINCKFEILSEEDEEIDIDSIEELDYCLEALEKPSYEESWLMNCIRANKDKLNELIKAVKQLNKK